MARLPPAKHLRIDNSAMRVLPALVGNETTRLSVWLTARDAASICDGHKSTSALGRRASKPIKSSRRTGHEGATPPAGSSGTFSWKVFDQKSLSRWIAIRCTHHCGIRFSSPQISRFSRSWAIAFSRRVYSPRSRASRNIEKAPKKTSVSARFRPSKRKSFPSRSAASATMDSVRCCCKNVVMVASDPRPSRRKVYTRVRSELISRRINRVSACSIGEKFASSATIARRE